MKKPRSFIFPLLLLLYTFGPMVSLVTSGAIADRYDCHLEKEQQPCMIGRTDARQTLSSMEVFGYLSVLTIPTGFIGMVIYSAGKAGEALLKRKAARK